MWFIVKGAIPKYKRKNMNSGCFRKGCLTLGNVMFWLITSELKNINHPISPIIQGKTQNAATQEIVVYYEYL